MIAPKVILAGCLSVILLLSCEKEPNDYPIEPILYYHGISANTVYLSDTTSVIRIDLSFTDGNGDIGLDEDELVPAIFLKDSRDTTEAPYTYSFPFPYIAPWLRPENGSLEGSVNLNLDENYFSIKDTAQIALGSDTLVFKIFIRDDAGNVSNTVTTDTIYVFL